MLSGEMESETCIPSLEMFENVAFCCPMAGEGTISGLISNNAKVPTMLTTADKMKPGFDLSIRYHSKGFTSARVEDNCNVDCHDNFLYKAMISTVNMGL